MPMNNFQKRGVSPLIATVLLVMFTVVVIILVIIWGRNYIEEKAEKEGTLAQLQSECTNVEFKFVEACKAESGTKLLITLNNFKNRKIDAFVFQFKDGTVDPVEILNAIKGGESEQLEVKPVNMALFEAESVNIIPQLKAGKDVYVPCSAKAVEVRLNNLQGCP